VVEGGRVMRVGGKQLFPVGSGQLGAPRSGWAMARHGGGVPGSNGGVVASGGGVADNGGGVQGSGR
jgi:hypothetical protein